MIKKAYKIFALIICCLLFSEMIPSTVFFLEVDAAERETAIFSMKYLNISQGINGQKTHQGTKAIDLCGKDTGRDNFYAPFTGVVKRMYKDSYGGTTVWLQSSQKVLFADGTVDYMTILVIHDDDVSDLFVGKKIKQGDSFFREGSAGYATGNHVHFECGKGKFSGTGWHKNSYGHYMINNAINPYDALVVPCGTKVIKDYGYNWRYAEHSFDENSVCTECNAVDSSAVAEMSSTKYEIIESDAVSRKAPYSTYNKAKEYSKGSVVTVNGRLTNTENEVWYRLSDGSWIPAGKLKKYSSMLLSVEKGDYRIKNMESSKYLNVDSTKTANGTNVSVESLKTSAKSEKWQITKIGSGYKIKTMLNSSKVLNSYGNGVAAGNNVNLWSSVSGDNSQCWNFEKVSGGYLIRNVSNPNCVLTVDINNNVKVDTLRYGDKSQIWLLESLNCFHSYKETVKKATFTSNGSISYKCSLCGDVKSAKTTVYAVKTVELSYNVCIYNGKTKTPSVTVKDSKGKVLKKDVDYKVIYPLGRKLPGIYTITIILTGKYSGSKNVSFKINPESPKIIGVHSLKKGVVTLGWTDVSGESGYEVYHSAKKTEGFRKLGTYKANVTSATVSKLTSGKTCYFKVRTYKTVGDTKIYSSWSAVKSVKVR